MCEVESLRGTIQTLIAFLHQIGMEPPEGLNLGHDDYPLPISPPSSTVSSSQAFHAQQGLPPRVAVRGPQNLRPPGAYANDSTDSETALQILSPSSTTASPSPWGSSQTPPQQPAPVGRVDTGQTQARVGDIDPTVLGMEFVLA
jgi:hypothetical protein